MKFKIIVNISQGLFEELFSSIGREISFDLKEKLPCNVTDKISYRVQEAISNILFEELFDNDIDYSDYLVLDDSLRKLADEYINNKNKGVKK